MTRLTPTHGLRAASAVLAALPMLALIGCTFEDGRPWGELRPTVELRTDFADRADGDALRTSKDYLVEVDALTLDVPGLAFTLPVDGGSTAFDPAAPPPGYSLCHNGHCHHDDGRLVDYADIIAELAQASGAGAATVEYATHGDPLTLSEEARALELASCEDCAIPRGELSGARLYVDALELSLHVRDTRTGERARLPVEGLRVDGHVHAHAELFEPLALSFGPKHAPYVELLWETAVGGAFFDIVEWDLLLEDAYPAGLDGVTIPAGGLPLDLSESPRFEAWMRSAIESTIQSSFTTVRHTR